MTRLTTSHNSLPVLHFKSKEDRIRFFKEAETTKAEKELQRKAWKMFKREYDDKNIEL